MTCGVMGGKDWDEHLPEYYTPKPTTPEYTGIGYPLTAYSASIMITYPELIEEVRVEQDG